MKDLNSASEQYAHNWFNMHETNNFKALKQGFEAGVNSKYVQAKIIQAQIDVLLKYSYAGCPDLIEELEQQLKQLEHE
jgi:hypothetical protein